MFDESRKDKSHQHLLLAKMIYPSSLVGLNLTLGILFIMSFSWPVSIICSLVVCGLAETINRALEKAICLRARDFQKNPISEFQKDDLACLNDGVQAANSTKVLFFSWFKSKAYTNYCAFAVGKHLAENGNIDDIKAIRAKLQRRDI